ncbi:hypothetical protein JAAARDRAFT_142531 [Jaapia argillacea MUCL 33604]|uniref:Retrotransposon gag domain-containing protein n=1 Tax=Jaapia argillacea MUCL 33604 TaxID=933084 RepID=A0A067P8G1_9AGAM|nr:hypothetical protein JAAARDRAFT_200273 [Jaapia argillacea MUCL 33604]KDQ50107.1 hypothetical protein JAAARDRAFT_142531 [Jaapia argillacea MUCL 33604]
MAATALEPFKGDDDSEESGENFICAFFRFTMEADDAKRLAIFKHFLYAGSVADQWYKALAPASLASWTALEAAFLVRWPEVKAVVKGEEEYVEELMGLRLKKEDVGKKVEVAGIEVWSHVAWADKIFKLAVGGKISGTKTYISLVRKELPDVIKDKVSSNHADWALFTKAARDIEIEYIKDSTVKIKEEAEREKLMEERLKLLESPTAVI